MKKLLLSFVAMLLTLTANAYNFEYDGISAYSSGGAVMQTNDLINSGSKLNWSFSNNSNVNVTLLSLQLIDGVTNKEGNVMNVNEFVRAGSTVSYSTTIGALGIHIPVTCRFRYSYNSIEYFTDAVYGSFGPNPIDNQILSGTCGESVNYSYDKITRALTISGKGAIYDYDNGSNKAPWHSYADEIQKIEIESGITSIGYFAFYKCSGIMSLSIPATVGYIGSSAFEDCTNLASLNLSNGLLSIGGSAFEGCIRLGTLTIPATVNTIMINAFKNCWGLTDVYCNGMTVPNTDASAFNGVIMENVMLHVPDNVVNSYKSTWPWSNFKIANLPNPQNPQIDGISYTLKNDGTLEVTGLASWVTRTDIPGSVFINGNQYRVTSIGNRAFEGRSDITYLSIPNSVTYIGWSAFQGCSGLTSITIPNSVTFINDIAFSGCSGLTSISIPNSVTSVGEDVFKDTGWEKYQSAGILYLDNWALGYKGDKPVGELRIADGIKGIASASFSGCSGLTSLVIPNSMTFICNGAFYSCISLKTIVTKIENPFKIDRDVFSSETYTKAELIVPKGIKTAYQSTAGWNVFNKITEANDAFDLVDNGIYYNLKGDGTLEVAGLASWANRADIPSSITFNGTRYRVTSIAARAFEGRSDLTYLSIPYSIMSIGEFAFSSCGSSITVNIADPESWCKMKLGNEHASPLSSAGKMLVHDIETTSFEVPSTVTSIGAFTFYQCSCLKSLYIPSSVTSIGSSAFEDCDYLASLTLNEGLQSIGGSAFEGCKRLTSINIPSTVNTISVNAFKNCVSLTDVYCNAVNVPNTDATSFNGVFMEKATLHVPASAVGTYGSIWPWNNFKEIVPIGADGIMGVKQSDDRHAEYYDLTGRKVHQPQKGLYIKNGKKTIVK